VCLSFASFLKWSILSRFSLWAPLTFLSSSPGPPSADSSALQGIVLPFSLLLYLLSCRWIFFPLVDLLFPWQPSLPSPSQPPSAAVARLPRLLDPGTPRAILLLCSSPVRESVCSAVIFNSLPGFTVITPRCSPFLAGETLTTPSSARAAPFPFLFFRALLPTFHLPSHPSVRKDSPLFGPLCIPFNSYVRARSPVLSAAGFIDLLSIFFFLFVALWTVPSAE